MNHACGDGAPPLVSRDAKRSAFFGTEDALRFASRLLTAGLMKCVSLSRYAGRGQG